MPDVAIRLLGRFAVSIDGREVEERAWRLRKARTLVKLLALEPDRRLHREQLMDLLWPALDATAAQNNLHQALHAARRVLGPDVLALADGMVTLADRVASDVDAFERDAATARESADPALYEAALARYGGELLPEDRYEPWCETRRSVLSELHSRLCLELADLQVEGDAAPDAVLTLQRALGAQPLHEPTHRALMRLYDRIGRRQEALAQYQRLRTALRHALEADPDAETRQLYRTLLASGEATSERPPRSSRLPVALTSFVGRERELEEVARLLEDVRLLTLVGPGGSGKTRLAIAAAERTESRHPDGVWFVELGTISDPALVAEATATALGITVPSRRTAAEAVAEHLADRSALLVLDTCEHVLDTCATLAETVLRVCPAVTLLATSRESLRCAGETAWRVPGLEAPESVALFLDRARATDPAFEPGDEHAAAVATVCARLDGMPLAIELAAARVAALQPAQIAARLEDSLDVLSSGSRTALTRQQTLRATINWSHDLLTDEERVLFRRLSVFAGSFQLDAVEDVCSGGAIEWRQVADLLARLVEKSLVVVFGGGSDRRYRLLDTIRQFAAERLLEAGERDGVEGRHLVWALALAALHDPDSESGVRQRSLERLELDHDNLRAALDEGLRHDPQEALRLASVVWRFWLDRNYFTEGVRRLLGVLDATPETTELRARTELAVASLELRCGDVSSFVARARDAEAQARRSSNPLFAAEVIHRAGMFYVAGVGMGPCAGACEDALTLLSELDDRAAPLRASILHVSSVVPFYLGNYGEARRRLVAALDALDVADAATPPFFEGLTYGFTFLPEGPDGRLRPIWEETIMLFHRFMREPAQAYALCNLAVLERSEGRRDEARAALDEALERFRFLGDLAGEALALTGLGNWARTFGEPDAALEWLGAALELRRARGDRRAVGMTEACRGLALAFGGELEPARAIFERVHDTFRAADDAPGDGGTLITWGLAEERAGNLEQASRLVDAGAEAWDRHLGGHLRDRAWLAAGDIHLALGDADAARRCIARAEELSVATDDELGASLARAHPAAKPLQRSGKERPR